MFRSQQSVTQAAAKQTQPIIDNGTSRGTNNGFSNLIDLTGQKPDTGVVQTTGSDAQPIRETPHQAKPLDLTGYGSSDEDDSRSNRVQGNDDDQNRSRGKSAESNISSLHSDEKVATEDQVAFDKEHARRFEAMTPEERAEWVKQQYEVDVRDADPVLNSSESSERSGQMNYFANHEAKSDDYEIEGGGSVTHSNSS